MKRIVWIPLCLLILGCGESRDVLLSRAQQCREQGDFTAAQAAYERILAKQPEDLPAIEGMIAVSRVRNATEDYTRWNRELLKFRPWDRTANIVVGKHLLEEGELADAVTRFVLALNNSEFRNEKQEAMMLLELARQKQEALTQKKEPVPDEPTP